ncbi:MAG: fumarylacetoacetate hydrolase family protein [Burkholderiales bacterium]|nr:fumarylacetoacetate hydrolase family protein [Burkholderiales bacterium]
MRFLSFREGGAVRSGVLSEDAVTVRPFAGAVSLQRVIESVEHGNATLATDSPIPLSQVELLAPLPRPSRNVFCVGLNYRSHAAELAARGFNGAKRAEDLIPPAPVVFSKVPESVIGPTAVIEIPAASSAIDYEAELAIVIGKGGRNIAAAQAMDHVFGYTIVNDVTARDLQKRHQQWLLGKSCDTFCPMGPWIVTRDAMNGNAARVRLWVNEELRQDGNTSDLVFGIEAIIESISAALTLQPGDVIATGTPAGVGMATTPPRWLKRGDVVKVQIDGIGVLENRVV